MQTTTCISEPKPLSASSNGALRTRLSEYELDNLIELEACATSPGYFLEKYAYIINRNTGKEEKWQPWQYQLDLLENFLTEKEIVILKARQLGISWLVCGYALWVILFKDAAKVLFLSQGEDEAWQMVSKVRFMLQRLPDFMRLKLKSDTRSILQLYGKPGEIKALPSTENAGRSTDATLVIRDELAYHPYGEKNASAIGPCIDGGGQIIDLSTINKEDTKNYFTRRAVKSYNKEDNSSFHFLGWDLRPTREDGMSLEEWWEKRIVPKYSAAEREKEYPRTLEEALAPPKTTCFFDIDAVNIMLKDIASPIREERNGIVRFYKDYVAGRKYVLVGDPSLGYDDPCAYMIVDWATCEKVAAFGKKMNPNEQALIVADLWERYGKPYTAIERNSSGLTVIEKLKDFGLNRWHYADKARTKEGWHTNSATRPVMTADLSEAIRLHQIREVEEEAITQFRSFIRTDRHPDGVASGNGHDEWVLCWAIFWQVRRHVKLGVGKVFSFHYKES